jgi:hypothetical protein
MSKPLVLLAASWLAALAMSAPAAATPNTCSAKQIQSPAGARCIDKNLGLGDMRFVLYCSSTGKLLCCELDDKGNIKDHSCEVAQLRALVPAVRFSITDPRKAPVPLTPPAGLLEPGPGLPTGGPAATGAPLGGAAPGRATTSGPSFR